MTSNLVCRICGGPITYSGRGATPEMHKLCGTLGNDVARVERALIAAWKGDYTDKDGNTAQETGIRKRGMRRWLVGELWRAVNTVTSDMIVRKTRATPEERLERAIIAIGRTKAGRAALEARGIALEAPAASKGAA